MTNNPEVPGRDFGRIEQAVLDLTKSVDGFTREFKELVTELKDIKEALNEGTSTMRMHKHMIRLSYVWLGLLTIIQFPKLGAAVSWMVRLF